MAILLAIVMGGLMLHVVRASAQDLLSSMNMASDVENKICGRLASYLVCRIVDLDKVNYADCEAGIPISSKGSSLHDIQRYLRSQSLYCYSMRLNDKNLASIRLCILLKDNHYFVLAATDKSGELLVYNGHAFKTVSQEEISSSLEGQTFPIVAVYPEFQLWLFLRHLLSGNIVIISFASIFLMGLARLVMCRVRAYRSISNQPAQFLVSLLLAGGLGSGACSSSDQSSSLPASSSSSGNGPVAALAFTPNSEEVLPGLVTTKRVVSDDFAPTSMAGLTNRGYSFDLLNVSQAPIEVFGLKTSCGCVEATTTATILWPKRLEHLNIVSEGYPGTKKTILVAISTSAGSGMLQYTYTIKSFLYQSSNRVEYTYEPESNPDQVLAFRVGMANMPNAEPFEIYDAYIDGHPAFDVQSVDILPLLSKFELTNLLGNDEDYLSDQIWSVYEIQIGVSSANIKERVINGYLVIETNRNFPVIDSTTLRVPLVVRRRRTIEVRPERIYFSVNSGYEALGRQSRTVYITFDRRKIDELSIARVVCPDNLQVSLQGTEGESQIKLSAEFLPTGGDWPAECIVDSEILVYFNEILDPLAIPVTWLGNDDPRIPNVSRFEVYQDLSQSWLKSLKEVVL